MSAQPYDLWYSTTRWRRRRAIQLARKPICEWCERHGRITVATIAHHAEPHRGDPLKFWHGPLVSLCKTHHDSDAQTIERGGTPRQEIGPDGWPLMTGGPDQKNLSLEATGGALPQNR